MTKFAALAIIASSVFVSPASAENICKPDDKDCFIAHLQSQINDLQAQITKLNQSAIHKGDTVELEASQYALNKCIAAQTADKVWLDNCQHGISWRIWPN